MGEQNSQSERILKFQLDIDNCNREKEQLALQVNEEAQGKYFLMKYLKYILFI